MLSTFLSFSGATRSHTNLFATVRSQHLEHYTVETNKLLIRLDKILRDLPTDPMKRKGTKSFSVIVLEVTFKHDDSCVTPQFKE